MKVLVTGGSGFIGSSLANYLLKNNYDVIIFDNLSNSSKEKITSLTNKGAKFVEGDILNYNLLSSSLVDVDFVIHLAAKISVSESILNPSQTFEINVNGTINPSIPLVDPSGAVLQRPNSQGIETFKRACRKGTQNPIPIIDGSNNLTNAQKYTAQQIVIAQKNIAQNRYFAPTDTDILLRFPVDRDSPDRTVPMIYENDGIQKRTYFGPTTLKRLRVQLLDDKGYPINLSNMNFSFSLIVEQLYQY